MAKLKKSKQYLCTARCHYRINPTDRCQLYWEGSVYNFAGEPDERYFVPIEDAAVDFDTASVGVLTASSEWEMVDAINYMRTKLGVDVHPEDPPHRDRLIKMLVDARDRYVDPESLK